MTKLSAIKTALLAGVLVCSSSAFAQVCLEIDESKDQLQSNDREATLVLMKAAFEKAGETIVEGSCDEKYTFATVKLGKNYITTIKGPKGNQTSPGSKIEELGSTFEQMVNSLLKGSTPGDTAGAAVTRNNITARQAVPNRIENDSLIYANVGPGYIVGVDPDEVPIALGGGYRYELDSFALDLGGQLVIASGEDSGGVSFLANLGGVYFLDPIANNSAFLGGGLGLSSIVVGENGQTFNGGGLHARVSAGFEFFRASNMRLILQADATLPLYDLEGEDRGDESESVDTKYAPVLGLSVGAGWSKERKSITVRHL